MSEVVIDPYISDKGQPLSVNQIRKFFREFKLLSTPDKMSGARYWTGEKEEKS